MNEFCAIMGLCNLNNINKAIEKRKLRYEYYKRNLKDIKGIRTFKDNLNSTSNYSYFPVLVNSDYHRDRDELYEYLKCNNIYTRKYFYPITADQKCFECKYKETALPQARWISKRVLVLPMYEELDIRWIEQVTDMICNS